MQKSIVILSLSGLGLIGLAGCGSARPQSLSSSAFEPLAPIPQPAPSQPRQAPAAAATTQPTAIAKLIVLDAPTTQPTTAPTALQSGQYNTLGGIVAEVNGTPIYAETLLNSQRSKLAATAAQMNASDFHDFVRDDLYQARKVLIDDERKYALAMLHLSDDDKKLAEAIMMRERNLKITEAGGSLELAKRKAIAQGTDFDYMMQELNREIINDIYVRNVIYARIEITAADMRKYYRANLDTLYSEKDQAQYRIIKIDPARIGGADAREAAMKRIRSIRDRAEHGEDFATLASNENQDDYLKKNSGDPGGWMQRDSYRIDAVDHAVWKLQPDQISPVIESDDAFYIVKLEARKTGRIRPFDDPSVQAEIYNVLAKQQQDALELAEEQKDEGDIVERTSDGQLESAVDMAMQEYPRWSGKETTAGVP